MPLFLNAEPASTGTIFRASVDLRMDLRISSAVSSLSVQILFQQIVVVLGNVIDHLAAMLVVKLLVNRRNLQRRGNIRAGIDKRLVPQLRDRKLLKLRAQRFLEPHDGFFFQEIDDADEIIFAAERELQGHRVSAQALAHGAHARDRNPRPCGPSY